MFSKERVDFKNELAEFTFYKKVQLYLHNMGNVYKVWVCTRDEMDHLVVYNEDLSYPISVSAEYIYDFFVGSIAIASNAKQRFIFEEYIREIFSEELYEQAVERAEAARLNSEEMLSCIKCVFTFQAWFCGQYHAVCLERQRFAKMVGDIFGKNSD
jgi:hypothetical protein